MMLEQSTCYLLLGSNLGNRETIINQAIDLINVRLGQVFSKSSLYETDAWGKTDQNPFLNIAVGIKTNLLPLTVLEGVLEIEKELGRVRKEKWGERTIDIDLILFDDNVINIEEKLIIPHPEMQKRKFVLVPLAEIAADTIHPILNKSILELSENNLDILSVKKL